MPKKENNEKNGFSKMMKQFQNETTLKVGNILALYFYDAESMVDSLDIDLKICDLDIESVMPDIKQEPVTIYQADIGFILRSDDELVHNILNRQVVEFMISSQPVTTLVIYTKKGE